eukprot:759209-Hanusia_phi.AAC.8
MSMSCSEQGRSTTSLLLPGDLCGLRRMVTDLGCQNTLTSRRNLLPFLACGLDRKLPIPMKPHVPELSSCSCPWRRRLTSMPPCVRVSLRPRES